MNEHQCNKVKCGNCKDYVNMDHKCYMLKEDVKPHSEKYAFFDLEDILRRGCIKLRELFIEIARIDPFQYTTIAGVCHAIYSSEYLAKDTIGICDEAATD